MTGYLLWSGIALLVGFVLTVALAPLVIYAVRRLKAGQNILHYVDNHKSKQGTPTMGGIAFILAALLGGLFVFRGQAMRAGIAVAVTVAYGVIGFLDDYIKIRFKRNLGLRAYQKIISQLAIAVAVAVFAYRQGDSVRVPFTNSEMDFGWWLIPFVIFVFLAVTNSVNLTDGLDGLAGGVTLVYSAAFSAVIMVTVYTLMRLGATERELEELSNLGVFGFLIAGAMLGYLIYNGFPAKIFMGDTGSLALGGAIGAVCVLSGLQLIMPIIGVMFVVSAVSVVSQVLYFKATKGKRILLMAPFHHHLELKGWHESKITIIYMIITAVMGAIVFTLYAALGGL